MRKMAIVSDIHGNREAFEAVLADIDAQGVDQIFSLGDNVGYGPDPEAVVQHLQARRIPSVRGNHELAVTDPRELNWFNPVARESLRKTVAMLSPEAIDRIHQFPYYRIEGTCRFVHGFPPDSPVIYQFQVSDEELRTVFADLDEQIFFIGHTHYPEIIEFNAGQPRNRRLDRQPRQLRPDSRYIINVGSVGQPRDGNNNAKYLIFDPSNLKIELRYVPYDIETTVKKILDAGLPEAHALRLR